MEEAGGAALTEEQAKPRAMALEKTQQQQFKPMQKECAARRQVVREGVSGREARSGTSDHMLCGLSRRRHEQCDK